MKNPPGDRGRRIEVAPARFPGWIGSFARRHGEAAPEAAVSVTAGGGTVLFAAPDGATAECRPPFWESPPSLPRDAAECADAIAAHALGERSVGVLLVRLGGYAAGVFTGSPPALADSKTGSRLVHGRSAAGGWSQHRFARRREKQAAEALQAAAGAAAGVWGRWTDGKTRSGKPGGLDVVVFGGDRRAIAGVQADPRLAPYRDLVTSRFLTVPDPKLAVLTDAPRRYLAVRIFLREPATG